MFVQDCLCLLKKKKSQHGGACARVFSPPFLDMSFGVGSRESDDNDNGNDEDDALVLKGAF